MGCQTKTPCSLRSQLCKIICFKITKMLSNAGYLLSLYTLLSFSSLLKSDSNALIISEPHSFSYFKSFVYYTKFSCSHWEHAQSHFSCVRLWATLWDCSLPGSSVHGILQARILEWVTVPSSRGSSWPRDRTSVCYISCKCLLHLLQVSVTSPASVCYISCIVGGLFTAESLGNPAYTLCCL